MTSEKSVERSIDTLQRIYAVIAALAINEGLKRVFLGQDSKLAFHADHVPEFIAFVFTAVPFVRANSAAAAKSYMARYASNLPAGATPDCRGPAGDPAPNSAAFFALRY